MSSKGPEATGPYLTSYFIPASMSPSHTPPTGPFADRLRPKSTNGQSGGDSQPGSSIAGANQQQPARKRPSIPPPVFYGRRMTQWRGAQGQNKTTMLSQSNPRSSGTRTGPNEHRDLAGRINKQTQRHGRRQPLTPQTQNSRERTWNQDAPKDKSRPNAQATGSQTAPAAFPNLMQVPVVHYTPGKIQARSLTTSPKKEKAAESAPKSHNSNKNNRNSSRPHGGKAIKPVKNSPTAAATPGDSTVSTTPPSSAPLSSTSSLITVPPTAPSSSQESSESPPARADASARASQAITSAAAMTNQQKISLLQMLIDHGSEYSACPYGDRSRELSFWLMATSLASREHGLEFSSGGALKKGVAMICRSRLSQLAVGSLKPGLDDLSRAIDKWNEIVGQRDQAHAAQREEAGRSKRWIAVPQDVRSLAQSRLSRDFSTLCNPYASAEDLEVASHRIAVILSSDAPQLTQRYRDKVLGQLEQIRKEKGGHRPGESGNDDGIPASQVSMTAREGVTMSCSPRVQTPQARRRAVTLPSPASSSTSSTLVETDTAPSEAGSKSKSRKRKRDSESQTPKRDRKKKRHRSRSQSANAGDGLEPTTPKEVKVPHATESPLGSDGDEEKDGEQNRRERHDATKTWGKNQLLDLDSRSPSASTRPTSKKGAGSASKSSSKPGRKNKAASCLEDEREALLSTRQESTDSIGPFSPESSGTPESSASRGKKARRSILRRPRPSPILGENGGGNTPSPAPTRKSSASVILLENTPPSSPQLISSTPPDKESPERRRRRAQTDYESEEMSSIVQRHNQESRQEYKTMRKTCRELQAELKRLKAIVLERGSETNTKW